MPGLVPGIQGHSLMPKLGNDQYVANKAAYAGPPKDLDAASAVASAGAHPHRRQQARRALPVAHKNLAGGEVGGSGVSRRPLACAVIDLSRHCRPPCRQSSGR